MTRIVNCIKLGIAAEGLDFAPLPGELAQKIFDNISKEAWNGWVRQQTMIINENRLNLSDESARKYLRQQLEYYLFAGN